MIDIFKRFFGNDTMREKDDGQDREHEVTVAVCALFLEMGRIDETFTQEEMQRVLSLLTEKYGLSRDHADALIKEADREGDLNQHVERF